MDDRIRVMHVSGRLDVGGSEQLLLITAKFNLNEKYDLAFTVCESKDGFVSRQIQDMGYPVYGLELTNKVYDVRNIPNLIKIFNSYKPHIVHLYSKISISGIIAAKMANIPVIISNQIDMWGDWGLGLKWASHIYKKLDVFVDKYIACSKAVEKFWGMKDHQKRNVMYLPFDPTLFPDSRHFNGSPSLYKNEQYPVIGIISRISSEKGHMYLIKAMEKILVKFPDVKLKIVGTGPLLNELKELVRALKLEKSIEFTGFVKDLSSALLSFDIFVLPSYSEGFPLSIMEAMAAGLPVAASEVGGIPEIIDHGKTGYLFPSRNSDAIADTIIRLLSEGEQTIQMGKRGREKVMRELSPDIYMQKLDSLYNELISVKWALVT
jgi:glycosyltransferase involved in cell wall biosynthesis